LANYEICGVKLPDHLGAVKAYISKKKKKKSLSLFQKQTLFHFVFRELGIKKRTHGLFAFSIRRKEL
jgi:hypothetical protein